MPITYTITKLNPEDPMDSTIEKTGHVVEFSMTAVNAHKKTVEKTIRELEGQKAHEDAKLKNIEEHHEFVQKMTEFELATAAMYYDARVMSKACAEKLVELIEQTKKDDAEVEEIFRQCPDLSLVPSKKLDADLPTPPVEETVVAPVEEVPADVVPSVDSTEEKTENNG